jgi:hypothetical protein
MAAIPCSDLAASPGATLWYCIPYDPSKRTGRLYIFGDLNVFFSGMDEKDLTEICIYANRKYPF